MGKGVLIVDDCTHAVAQLSHIVDALPGFQVVGHARDGAEGVRIFAALKPEVVCMDIVMPQLDGLQAARTILHMHPETIVYMISSIAEVPSKLSQAISLGARDIMPKPFDVEQVRAMLLVGGAC